MQDINQINPPAENVTQQENCRTSTEKVRIKKIYLQNSITSTTPAENVSQQENCRTSTENIQQKKTYLKKGAEHQLGKKCRTSNEKVWMQKMYLKNGRTSTENNFSAYKIA